MAAHRHKPAKGLGDRDRIRGQSTPLACALACLWLLHGAPAEAGLLSRLVRAFAPARPAAQPVERSRKAHLLRPELYARLKPETQANFDSLVHYSGPQATGSAVLIGGWQGKRGRIRGLVLTNNHVVDQNHDATSALTFGDGTQVTNSRLVARNRFLDYALLEVELPAKAQVRPAPPLYGVAGLGLPVYSMGAATSMTTAPMEDLIGGGPRVRTWLKQELERSGLDDYPVISRGTISTEGPLLTRLADGGRAHLTASDLAGAPGSSGGPVFDASSHALVGIHVAGIHDAKTSWAGMSSSGYILHDLWKQQARNRIPTRHRDLVGALLDETIPRTEPAR